MDRNFNISVSPHIRKDNTTQRIMGDVLIALIPVCLFGIWNFGLSALRVLVASVTSCVVSEILFQFIVGRRVTVDDLSAAVTGVILGINLPATVPLWIPVLGGAFAIIIVKQLYGGLGQNFMNPALAARCFLLISFGSLMANYPAIDGISGATPLAVLKAGGEVNLLKMFLGTTSGVIGETSVLAILIGFIYLVARKVIQIRIPVIYVGSTALFVALFSLIANGELPSIHYLLAHVCGGGLLVGAVFMATDYVSSPVTNSGRVIYAVLLGFLTATIRLFSGSAEGVSYAIIIGNMLTPLIEKITIPTAFGREGKR